MPRKEKKNTLTGPEYGSGIKGIKIPENLENVKKKIRKLLALSKSDNGNEAAAVLQKAFELVEKYEFEETARIFWPEIYALRKMEKTVDKTQRKGL